MRKLIPIGSTEPTESHTPLSIYKRLNPTLLVQAGVSLGLLHWANISNIHISLTPSLKLKTEA